MIRQVSLLKIRQVSPVQMWLNQTRGQASHWSACTFMTESLLVASWAAVKEAFRHIMMSSTTQGLEHLTQTMLEGKMKGVGRIKTRGNAVARRVVTYLNM